IDEMLASGDRVVTRWTGEGTHRGALRGLPASGRQARVTGISIHRIAGGRIVETWVNWDTLGMMEQLGAAQVPARRAVGR
ncbi:MAG TPA: ester cyclase, partial [Gemmatimonadales bacterium]|nr:ester cyclase [Gemmatimonadales bacterium]